MKDETLAAPIYHGFLPPKSRERQINLPPRLYTQIGEKIHLTFLPLRPDLSLIHISEPTRPY